MHFKIIDALADQGVGAWQEAGAHPVGDITKPQIEGGGLDLSLCGGAGQGDDFCSIKRSMAWAGKMPVMVCACQVAAGFPGFIIGPAMVEIWGSLAVFPHDAKLELVLNPQH